jgi:hypothetical protein
MGQPVVHVEIIGRGIPMLQVRSGSWARSSSACSPTPRGHLIGVVKGA